MSQVLHKNPEFYSHVQHFSLGYHWWSGFGRSRLRTSL
eukprot:COSAG02_NODE_4480_length_5314_cov_6.582167_3_plen_38_part_00